jgi:putative RNA 2'-phosphotransferase
MNEVAKDRLRRQLLAVLRHIPEKFQLRMDQNGWVDALDIGDVINILLGAEHQWDSDSVQRLVLELGLIGRIQFKNGYCRASYGHSTSCFDPIQSSNPDCCLYHGTTSNNVPISELFGLQPGNRRFVHLSTDIEYASNVACKDHHQPVIYQVRRLEAIELGVQFFSTRTHVWLATSIPAICLQLWMSEAPATIEDRQTLQPSISLFNLNQGHTNDTI